MRATKQALWGALETGLTDACRAGAQHLAGLWGHPDQDEGPRAFAERRDPIGATNEQEADVTTTDATRRGRPMSRGRRDNEPNATTRDEADQ